jgi:hypothetical protein
VKTPLLCCITDSDHGEVLESARQIGCFLESLIECEGGEAGFAFSLGGVEVEPAELFQVGDTE